MEQSKNIVNKNLHIELYRIIFTFLIIFHHYDKLNGAICRGYLAVEFFFILSGFLLMRTYSKNREIKVRDYAVGRVKRLYPSYILALIGLCILKIVIGVIKGIKYNLTQSIFSVISEIFMLNTIGVVKTTQINYAAWYVGVLLVSCCLIYAILKQNERIATNIILPVFVVIIYSFLCNTGLEHWSFAGPFYIPLLRGIAGVSMGVMLYNIYIYIYTLC